MNILFDQTEAQAPFFNGAAEYAQAVFLKLASVLNDYPEVKVYCLYSSEYKFKYGLLEPSRFAGNPQIIYVDYKNRTLKDIVKDNGIDLLFITCAQAFCDLRLGDLRHLGCRVDVVIHDLLDEEMHNSRVELFKLLGQPKRLCRHLLGRINVRLRARSILSRKAAMQNLILNNNVRIITVSEYTKNTIRYNYPYISTEISVYAAPPKVVKNVGCEIENSVLRKLVAEQVPYFLLLSADRPLKNAKSMINAFRVYAGHMGHETKLLTVGYSNSEYSDHISLPFLSASDLENAYRHCRALLYPSLFEGFGYPPMEAMRYSKPVICSNVCSMQEVLEDAPVYFSPIYESDMYRALRTFSNIPYDDLCIKSYRQYCKETKKQNDDLDLLVKSFLTYKNK